MLVTRLSRSRKLNFKKVQDTFFKYMARVSKYSFTPHRIDCPCALIFTKNQDWCQPLKRCGSVVTTIDLCLFLKFLNILVIVDLCLQNVVGDRIHLEIWSTVTSLIGIHCACIFQQLDSILQILGMFVSSLQIKRLILHLHKKNKCT